MHAYRSVLVLSIAGATFAAMAASAAPNRDANALEAHLACVLSDRGGAKSAPLPTRDVIRNLERENPVSQDMTEGGPSPFVAYARFYTARRYHGRTWYCGTYADLSGLGVGPGIHFGGVAKTLGGRAYIGPGIFITEKGQISDGGCAAGHYAFDAAAGRLAWFACNGG